MFTISNSNHNFTTILLQDLSNNTTVGIVPSCGATLQSFTVSYNNSTINIIDFYDDAEDFENNVTGKGFKSCKMAPFACRIKDAQYQLNDATYTIEKFKLGSSAIHGLIYDAPFTVINQSADDTQAGVILMHQYLGTDKGYPFHFDCLVSYQLKTNNELTIKTSIVNKHSQPIPVQDGWHPYFTFGGNIDDLLLEFQSAEHVLFDEELIPNGELKAYDEYASLKKIGPTFFDDCFTLNFDTCQPMCVLRDNAQKIQLEIRPDKSYPYLQIYTPPHRESIAIENLSAPPNAFNSGNHLIMLQPGAEASFSTSYIIKALG